MRIKVLDMIMGSSISAGYGARFRDACGQMNSPSVANTVSGRSCGERSGWAVAFGRAIGVGDGERAVGGEVRTASRLRGRSDGASCTAAGDCRCRKDRRGSKYFR